MTLYGIPFHRRVENNAALYDRTFMALYGIPFQGRVENNAALYDRTFMALYGRPFQERVENNAVLHGRAFMALYGRPFQGRVENNAALYDSERPRTLGQAAYTPALPFGYQESPSDSTAFHHSSCCMGVYPEPRLSF